LPTPRCHAGVGLSQRVGSVGGYYEVSWINPNEPYTTAIQVDSRPINIRWSIWFRRGYVSGAACPIDTVTYSCSAYLPLSTKIPSLPVPDLEYATMSVGFAYSLLTLPRKHLLLQLQWKSEVARNFGLDLGLAPSASLSYLLSIDVNTVMQSMSVPLGLWHDCIRYCLR